MIEKLTLIPRLMQALSYFPKIKIESIQKIDPSKKYLLRFDGGCRGNGTLSGMNISNNSSNNTILPLPQTACGSILTLEDEKTSSSTSSSSTSSSSSQSNTEMTILWQQAAWLWPGPPTSAFTSFTSSSSLSSLNLINPPPILVPGEIAATNNTAEFIALLEGLRLVHFLGIKRLVIQGDSQLIVKLITGEFIAHKPHLQLLVQAAIALLTPLDEWSVRHVPRNLNFEADALCAKGFELGESIDISTLIELYACRCEIAGAISGASFVRNQGKINDSMIGKNTSLTMSATSNDIKQDSLKNVEVVIAPVWFLIASSLQGKNENNCHLSTINSISIDKIEQTNTKDTKEEGMHRFFQMLGLQ